MSVDWPTVSIDELKAKQKGSIAVGPFGSRMKSDCYVDYGIPVIRGKNITGGPKFEGQFVYITELKASELGSSNVFENDLIFPHRGSIGEVGIVPKNGRFVISSSLMKLSCDKNKANPKFLYYFFKSSVGKHELLKNASQVGTPGIGQPLNSLKTISLQLPNLTMQNRIVKIIASFDDKIELNQELNQALEQISQAIFKNWFVDFEPVKAKEYFRKLGGDSAQVARAAQAIISGAVNLEDIIDGSNLADLDNEIKSRLETKLGCQTKEQQDKLAETAKLFPDKLVESELGFIPEGWKRTALSEIIELKYGKALKKNNRKKGSIPVYGSGGLVGSHDEYFVKGPGVIVARKGSVGNLFWTENNFFPIDTTFFVSPVTKIPLYWVYMKLRTIDILSLSSDSAVPGVNRNALLSQKIVLPNLILLERFMNYITPFVKLKNANQNEIESLSSLRDELLPRLLSGVISLDTKESDLLKVV